MPEEFPSNSQRAKRPSERPEPKKVERVIEGEVVRRKKPLGRRLADVFIGQNPKSAAAFVALDVLLPAAKDTIADAFSQGIERMIFGEARSTSRRGGYRPGSGPVPYNRYSGSTGGGYRPKDEPRTELSRRGRATHNFDEIILNSRVEADEVIDRMFDILDRYQTVSVRDLYELLGIDADYTDDKWGWRDLRGAGVTRIREGYLLNLDKPEPIE